MAASGRCVTPAWRVPWNGTAAGGGAAGAAAGSRTSAVAVAAPAPAARAAPAASRARRSNPGARWIAAERAGLAADERLAFATVTDGRAVGHVVLKRPGGTGLAPRAVALLSAWALSPADGPALTRLELIHHADNPASCRVARKAGYPLEALLPRPRERHLHALTHPAAD
ncbi:hypothetical protein K353_05990 [Kitasatospora sp. SolWspMP-SS2h]|uniref:GNAT family N-acetyltransferase n=1 Tax=Kitasatospora sp. SolWspMP-SS2h TaxID=1305729 RepID=UPI000DC027B2|nr:GNAT family protein [Kitasatospora sp. SolWspMP-SS2h]RAJ31986.1 hypothetical protein K353_05990 [Kitasatospora sp. SolWspMP-SS2h]